MRGVTGSSVPLSTSGLAVSKTLSPPATLCALKKRPDESGRGGQECLSHIGGTDFHGFLVRQAREETIV